MTIQLKHTDQLVTLSEVMENTAAGHTEWRGTVICLKPAVIDAISKIIYSEPGRLCMPRSEADFMTNEMCFFKESVTENTPFMVLGAELRTRRFIMSASNWKYSTSPDIGCFLRIAPIAAKHEDRTTDMTETYLVPYETVDIRSTCHKNIEMIPGLHYNAPSWEVKAYQFSKLDFRVEGFSNLPTACMGVAIPCYEYMMQRIKMLVTKKGVINPNRLRQLARMMKMEEQFINYENRLVSGFPSERLSVNYEELAEYFAKY